MNLTRASKELFRRTPDECFPSLDVLVQHCLYQKNESQEIWQPPKEIGTRAIGLDRLMLSAGEGQTYQMNDWSFSQLCRLAGVAKETVNRLSPRHCRPRLHGNLAGRQEAVATVDPGRATPLDPCGQLHPTE